MRAVKKQKAERPQRKSDKTKEIRKKAAKMFISNPKNTTIELRRAQQRKEGREKHGKEIYSERKSEH